MTGIIDPQKGAGDVASKTGKAKRKNLVLPGPNKSKMPNEVESSEDRRRRFNLRGNLRRLWAVLALFIYLAGMGSGYLLWGRHKPGSASDQGQADQSDMASMAAQINPKGGYKIPAIYGDIGPELIGAGAIDQAKFVKLYQDMGKPLSDEIMGILMKSSNSPVVINQDNQHFLLNLFWAFGLANLNRVLTDGPMMGNGKAKVVGFASTGGWTLAARPIIDLYAGFPIVTLTEEQQKRLEDVDKAVYRPCCNNPTHFPDCNHGMAMLGMLELMASQNASTDDMFKAAKYVNAYWFPQQTLEIAVALKASKSLNFDQADSRQVVGQAMSSSSGVQSVHQWLAQNGLLPQAPQSGGSCGVN